MGTMSRLSASLLPIFLSLLPSGSHSRELQEETLASSASSPQDGGCWCCFFTRASRTLGALVREMV